MKILSICGSPRKGNSESILLKIKELLEEKGAENEIILLREKNIQRCLGCVEFCNKELKCQHNDDMNDIIEKMKNSDGLIFISPNYFAMPPGIFKDFMDKCSVFYTREWKTGKKELGGKKTILITVGTGKEFTITANEYIAKWFCGTLSLKLVAKKIFLSHSELKGNYNDIFENDLNENIEKDLEEIVEKMIK